MKVCPNLHFMANQVSFKMNGKTDFVTFKKISIRYKKIGYNMDILRQTACLAVKPVMFSNFASFFNCTTAS